MSNRRTYSFPHKSLPEFLAARCLWQDITAITTTLTPLLRGASEHEGVGVGGDGNASPSRPAPASASTNHVDAIMAATLAAVASRAWSLTRLVLGTQPAVISFLIDMLQRSVAVDAAHNSSRGGTGSGSDTAITLHNVVTTLYTIVRASGAATSAGYRTDTAEYSRIAVASSNCATVLSQAGVPLSGGVLRNALLRGALLSDAVMLDTVLCGADLRDARLERVIADGADLTGADLRGVRFVADVEVSLRQTLTQKDSEAGHTTAVLCVTVASDGKLAASGGVDGVVTLWDLAASGSVQPQRWHSHNGAVVAVCFGPLGRRVVSRGSDGNVRVWDVSQSHASSHVLPVDVVTAAEVCMGVTCSPDGSRVVTGSSTGAVVVVAVITSNLRRLKGHTATVSCVAYAPDGKVFASGCANNDGGVDGAVRLWDAHALTCLRVVAGCAGPVTAVSFTPDSRAVLTAGPRTAVQRWSVATCELAKWDDATAPGHDVAATAVCVSPDGQYVIGGCVDGAVRLWDADTGACVAATKAERTRVTDVAVAGKGNALVSTHGDSDGGVRVWRVVTGGSSIAAREGHVGDVTCVRYVPGGNELATAGEDGTVRLWDLASDAVRVIDAGGQRPVRGVAVSSSGSVLASGGDDGVVRLWDVATGAPTGDAFVHTRPVTGVAFSAIGTLVTSCEDGGVRVFHLGSGGPVATRTMQHSTSDRVNGVSCCPVALPQGVLAASVGNDRRVVVWNTVTGEEVHPLVGHADVVTTAAFSADGSLLASGGFDASVFVWDVGKGTCLAQLPGHTRVVQSLAFAAESWTLASGSWDMAVRVWDLRSLPVVSESVPVVSESAPAVSESAPAVSESVPVSGTVPVTVTVTVLEDAGDGASVSAVCFSPDGGSVVTGTAQGVVCVRDCDSDGWQRRKVYAEHRALSLSGCAIRWVEWGERGRRRGTRRGGTVLRVYLQCLVCALPPWASRLMCPSRHRLRKRVRCGTCARRYTVPSLFVAVFAVAFARLTRRCLPFWSRVVHNEGKCSHRRLGVGVAVARVRPLVSLRQPRRRCGHAPLSGRVALTPLHRRRLTVIVAFRGRLLIRTQRRRNCLSRQAAL